MRRPKRVLVKVSAPIGSHRPSFVPGLGTWLVQQYSGKSFTFGVVRAYPLFHEFQIAQHIRKLYSGTGKNLEMTSPGTAFDSPWLVTSAIWLVKLAITLSDSLWLSL